MCLTPYPVTGHAGVQSRNLEHVPASSQPWAWSPLLWNAFTEPSSAWMLHDFTQHCAFTSINIYHLPRQLSFLQMKSRRVLKKEVKSDSKNLFLGIPWRNNPGQYVKQKYFYLPRDTLCLESTRLHWFLFRALYVIKSTSSDFFSLFYVYYHSSNWEFVLFQSEDTVLQVLEHPQALPSHLQVIQQCETFGCFALQPVEGQTESKTGDFTQFCLHKASLCVCVQTGTPSTAATLCAGGAPAWAEPS